MTLVQACDFAEYAWDHSDVYDEKTDTHVSFQQDGTTLYVLFRGSESFQNALDDLEFLRRDWKGYSVADGFADCYDGVEAGIEAKIAEVKPAVVIYVGHSLGAFLALLGVISSLKLGRAAAGYGIGCPRGLGRVSAIRLRKKLENIFTWYRNDQDIITHLAPSIFLTMHVGKKIQVGKWWRFWTALLPDENNAHMVTQYRKNGGVDQ